MNELHLFAGAGGGILGGMLLGHTCVCAVEIEPYCRNILLQRQRDGILPRFPIWDNVCSFDGTTWRGKADIVCGGFPCQDISTAGQKAGIEGARSGLWKEMARIICEVEPMLAFVENSAALTFSGLGHVLGDLAEMGYDARWGVLGAKEAGLYHHRERIWILATHTNRQSRIFSILKSYLAKMPNMAKHNQTVNSFDRILEKFEGKNQIQSTIQDSLPSYLCRVDDGMANSMDRLKAIGNGQVPAVAAAIFCILSASFIKEINDDNTKHTIS